MRIKLGYFYRYKDIDRLYNSTDFDSMTLHKDGKIYLFNQKKDFPNALFDLIEFGGRAVFLEENEELQHIYICRQYNPEEKQGK